MRFRSRPLRLERRKATIASDDYCPLGGNGTIKALVRTPWNFTSGGRRDLAHEF